MDKALEIELHLQSAVPVLKGKHGPPVKPEGGGEHFVIKYILNGLVVECLIRGHKELDDLHAGPLTEVEFSVGVRVLPPVDRSPAQGVVGIVLVEPVELIQHRGTGLFQGGDGTKQIPQTFKVVFHLPAASHDISPAGVKNTVAGPAGNVHGLQNVDVGAGHLSVPHQKTGGCQGCQAAAHNIGVFLLHTLRFLRPGKGLIVAAGIVDTLPVSLVAAQFGIAVGIGRGVHCFFRSLLCVCQLLCSHSRCTGAGQACGRYQLSKVLCHRENHLSK